MRRVALLALAGVWLFGTEAVIYDGFGYIRERRAVEGTILSPLPKRLVKDSLLLSCGRQGYRYHEAKSVDELIKDSLRPGEQVRFVRGKEELTGKVLSVEPLVIQSGGRVFFDVGYRSIVVPSLDTSRLKPHIELFVPAKSCELEFLSGGFDARAFYVARLGERLELAGYFAIQNRSGQDLADAKISVVMGDIGEGGVPVRPMRLAAMAAPKVRQKGVRGLHRYDLAGRWELADGEEIVISYLHEHLPYNEVLEARMHDLATLRAGKEYRFERVVEFGAPAPMPSGEVRLYGEGLYLGKSGIAHTPKGEKVRLAVGRDFDVVLKKRARHRTETKRLLDLDVEYLLKNTKSKAVRVRLVERLPYSRYEIESDIPYKKLDASTIIFELLLEPGAQRRFAVRYRFAR